MKSTTIIHYKVVKQILRYLKGIIHFRLVYQKNESEKVITSLTDNDMAGDMTDQKTIRGMEFYINNYLMSWNSHKLKFVAQS